MKTESKLKLIKKICKGCSSYGYIEECLFASMANDICPCSTCLIKGICNTTCNEFDEYCEKFMIKVSDEPII